MTYTTNYNLKKPEGTDPVLVGDINDNSDIIDGALEDLSTGKQDTLTFDATPTAASTNPVTSGGVKTALDTKQDTLIAGENITIEGNTISATGGGGGSLPSGTNNNDILVWDADDSEWDTAAYPSGSLPSGTAVGDVLVWNGSAWVAKQPSRLPNGYQEVEYIESTGTQYIDLGIKGDSVMTAEVDFAVSNTGAWQAVFGTRGYNSKQGYILYIPTTGNQIRTDYAATTSSNNVEQLITLGTSLWDRRVKIKYEKSNTAVNVYENDSSVFSASISGSDWSNSITTLLFALQDATYPLALSTMKLYSAVFYVDGLLQRYLIPCYHKSSGVIGLYDTVNNVFYQNAGTGTFLKGNDV